MISKSFITRFLDMIDRVDKQQLFSFLDRVTGDLDFLCQAFDYYPDGILIFDDKCRLEYVNRKALEILRYDKPEEVLEKNVLEILHSPDFSEYLKGKIINQKAIREEEHLISGPFARVLRVNFLPIRDNTNLIRYYLLSFVDITRKKLEDMNSKRKESIASMMHLAAGIAHEIKNPLASIDIHLQLLDRYLTGAPEFQEKPEMKNFINVLKDEVNRLNSIIQDFLKSIRPSSFDLQKVNLAQLLQDLFSFLSLELKFYKIKGELSIESGLPFVLGDPRYLKMVFLNLLKNAMEAFDENQENKKIEIKAGENSPYVEVRIADNGKGISADKLDKIFDPYFTTKTTGTGIGLTTVHKIVTEHNGSIRVESEENRGTVFTVMLPLYKGESSKYIDSGKKSEL